MHERLGLAELALRHSFTSAALPSPLSTHLDNPPAATMSESPRPRSRFDKAETDRPPRSRFDRGERRSRSPSSREPDSRRTRSPVAREGTDSPATAEAKKAKALDAAAAAAAAAARINAQIQAKKGIQHVDVPPIRAVRYTLPLPTTAIHTRLLTFTRRRVLQSFGPQLSTRPRTRLARSSSKMATSSRT